MIRTNQNSILGLYSFQEAIKLLHDENVSVIQIEPVGNNVVSFLIEYLKEGSNEYKVLEFDKVNHNGTIISKDAFKDQDYKPVPLKWGSGPDAEVLGTVELNLEPDGVYMSIGKEDYEKIMKRLESNDEFQKFLDGLFKEPMVVHRI